MATINIFMYRTDHNIILKRSELTVNPQYNMTLTKDKRDRINIDGKYS